MKGYMIGLVVLFLAAAVLLQRCSPSQAKPLEISYQEYLAGKVALGCGPGVGTSDDWKDVPEGIPALPGWGQFHWQVTTNSDSAQYYFNQGISMYYSFHMVEAKASFAKAGRFDANCAMAWWGLAMAYGVNYNYAMLNNAPEAMEAMAKAIAAASDEAPLEKALVATLPARYNADTAISRARQNEDYAAAIRQVRSQYPNDANVAALYADALMVQHPWDLYDIAGQPKPWTPPIVQVLEEALAKAPNHPSLNHLYIHAVEGATDAEKGLPHAWRLSTMMPMVSHMVHMPSHIFIRTGHYREGMLVNDSSINGYQAYSAAFAPVENDAFLYLLHNVHMKAACTLYRGSLHDARRAAYALQATIPSAYMQAQGGMGNYIQYMYATPLFMQIRFGQWDSLLQAKSVPADLKYLRMVQAFGQGMAYAKKGQTKQAEAMLADMQQHSSDPSFAAKFEVINPAEKSVAVMLRLLQGQIAASGGKLEEAAAQMRLAVEAEDAFWYGEPRDWLLPTRHYLADVLMQQQKFAEAEKVYAMELIINPKNVWSLAGMAEAQKKQGKQAAYQQTQKAWQLASEGADMVIRRSAL